MAQGGFSSVRETEAFRRQLDRKAALDAALPVTVEVPSDRDRKRGILLRFELTHPTHLWTLTGVCTRASDGGGLLIGSLTITPGDPDAGVTSAALRQVQTKQLLDAIRLRVDHDWAVRDSTALLLGAPAARPALADRGDTAPVRRGGRPAIGDDVLRQIAVDYIDLSRDGQRRVLERLGERHDRRPETVRDWVRAARRAQWLGPAKRGVAFGEPGPRLLEERR